MLKILSLTWMEETLHLLVHLRTIVNQLLQFRREVEDEDEKCADWRGRIREGEGEGLGRSNQFNVIKGKHLEYCMHMS